MTQQMRNHISKKRAEAGQAIVFVALFMVVMIGMLGLAIDGGGLLFLWRDAQGAADSAALSAAYARCTPSSTSAQIKARGLQTADRNGFRNSDPDHEVRIIVGNETTATVLDRETGDTVTEQVFIERQLNRALGSGHGLSPDTYVWADILAEKRAFFIQVLYGGPLTVNPSAMSVCDPGFDGDAFPGAFAYGDCGNQTFRFNGSSVLYQGDIHSNGQIVTPGANSGLVFNDVEMTYVQSPAPSPLSRDTTNDDAEVLVPPDQTWKATQVSPVPFSPDNFMSENDLANLYGPGGVVSSHIVSTYGASYYNTSPPSGNTWEGLYYLTGGGTHGINLKNQTVGPMGVTIISDGSIEVRYDKKYSDYPIEYFGPVMDEIDGRRYPGFIFVTTADGGCQKGDTDIRFWGQVGISAGIDFTTVNFLDPNEVTLGVKGVIYATNSGVGGNASQASYRGAVIARIIHMSMSRGFFYHDPTLIPDIQPSVSNVRTN
jgi:hypothetical protein